MGKRPVGSKDSVVIICIPLHTDPQLMYQYPSILPVFCEPWLDLFHQYMIKGAGEYSVS
jgi:hypothetical protein